MTAAGPSSGDDAGESRFAVLSRRAVFVVACAAIAGAVWLIVNDRLVSGVVLIVAAGLVVLARGLWTLRRGTRALGRRGKARVPAPGGGTPEAPAAVERVVADLLGMNDDGLPYLVEASRTGSGVRLFER